MTNKKSLTGLLRFRVKKQEKNLSVKLERICLDLYKCICTELKKIHCILLKRLLHLHLLITQKIITYLLLHCSSISRYLGWNQRNKKLKLFCDEELGLKDQSLNTAVSCRSTRTPCRLRSWSQQGGNTAQSSLGPTCRRTNSVTSRRNR